MEFNIIDHLYEETITATILVNNKRSIVEDRFNISILKQTKMQF